MQLAETTKGGTYALLAWILVTGALNALFRARTPAEWEALCEERPRLAAMLRMLRGLGVDPKKVLSALLDFLAAQGARR